MVSPGVVPGTPPSDQLHQIHLESAIAPVMTGEKPVSVKIGINGFGRIGRNYFRAALAQGADLEIVAVNDLTDNKTLAHLLKYDSITGRLDATVDYDDENLIVDGKSIKAFAERDPANLPWASSASTSSSSRPASSPRPPTPASTSTPAKKVPISAPATDEDATFVIGVNEDSTTRQAPHHLERVVHHQLPGAAREGLQRRVRHRARPHDDRARLHRRPEPPGRPHKDLRRARAAALNIVPTSTGAAKAIGLVLPELVGKLDGFALRVPVPPARSPTSRSPPPVRSRSTR